MLAGMKANATCKSIGQQFIGFGEDRHPLNNSLFSLKSKDQYRDIGRVGNQSIKEILKLKKVDRSHKDERHISNNSMINEILSMKQPPLRSGGRIS